MKKDDERVIEAINTSRFIWRPAEAISKETGLSTKRVRNILETTTVTEIYKAAHKNSQGYVLYTTREHLVHLAPTSVRLFGTRESS